MTNVYESKPWLANYDADTPPNVDIEHVDALTMFRASLERDRTAPIIRYFDRTVSFAELDEMSDALAVALAVGRNRVRRQSFLCPAECSAVRHRDSRGLETRRCRRSGQSDVPRP